MRHRSMSVKRLLLLLLTLTVVLGWPIVIRAVGS